jgi:hypothetical protein
MIADLFRRENWIYVEWIIIGGIFLWQLDISMRIYLKIREFKNIFSTPLNVSLGGVPTVWSSGRGQATTRIVKALNAYLASNYHTAINFGIINDTIDREIEVKDEEITQAIPTPLYLGLAATMIGIILGLLSMPPLSTADTNVFQHGIDALVNGVRVAMGASLTGLISTTILSTRFYKSAREIVMNRRSDQLSELQAKLLPELIRADDTGIAGLRSSIDRYATDLTAVSKELVSVASQAETNLRVQKDVIERMEGLNISRVAKTNLELFKGLEGAMPVFSKFLGSLTEIARVAENLEAFSKRSEDLEAIATEIKSALKESKEVSKFLTTHLQKIDAMGKGTLEAVDLSDSYFRRAIEKLTENIDSRIKELNAKADTADSNLKDMFEEIGLKLNEVTTRHLATLSDTYANATPHFAQLDNLKFLPELRAESLEQSKELMGRVTTLNETLTALSKKVDSQPLYAKLDSLEKGIREIAPRSVQTKEAHLPKKGSFWGFLKGSSRLRERTTKREGQ